MRTPTSLPARTRLTTGQALRLHADAGTGILATEGSISVAEAPLWSGDQFLRRSTMLREGEFYVVQDRGWITVDAHGPAEVLCHQPHAQTIDPAAYPFFALLARVLSLARLS
ncbi:hypothetical protein ACFQAT_06695 [Undibacterium arcticum]|uniref:Hedgehog/Intein (Hint) domain-containing protein n=1 Tax=Undibacterium arcticum TaxID=1762892 RepID=A0ABV7F171_9BURK